MHSFREEKNYIIDVAFQQPEKPPALPSPAADASHAPAPAAPATAAPRSRPAASRVEPLRRPGRSSEIVPPTSEMIAKQAKIEIKPEAAPKSVPAPESPQPAPPSK